MAELEIIPRDHALTREVLEIVRVHEGFETIEQAAEFLLAMAVRKGVKAMTGRGRALYAVERKQA